MGAHLRILRVTPTLDAEAGGPTTSIVHTAIAEARAGMDVTICSTRGPDSSADELQLGALRKAGVLIRRFARPPGIGRAGSWGLSPKLITWIFRNARSFDVIHLHYVWCLTTILGALIGRVRGVKVVLSPHESLTDFDVDVTSGHAVKRGAKIALRKLILANVDTVIFASDMEFRESHGDPARSCTICHPIAESMPPELAPEPPAEPFTVGFIGRIHPKKNLDVVIRAMAVPGAEPFRLVVAGAGDPRLEESVRELASELGVDDRIVWLGFVDPAGRDEFFRDVHVLAMPSRFESFGMSAAESMAAGVPPIVSRPTGVASIVEEFGAGLVIEEPTPEALAEAIGRLGTPGAREGYRENCRTAVDRKLTFRAYGADAKDLYEELLGREPNAEE